MTALFVMIKFLQTLKAIRDQLKFCSRLPAIHYVPHHTLMIITQEMLLSEKVLISLVHSDLTAPHFHAVLLSPVSFIQYHSTLVFRLLSVIRKP